MEIIHVVDHTHTASDDDNSLIFMLSISVFVAHIKTKQKKLLINMIFFLIKCQVFVKTMLYE